MKIKRIINIQIAIVSIGILIACKNDKQNNFNNSDLIGNWYNLNKNSYQELYFDGENKLYEYNPYAGNTTDERYKGKNDSMLTALIYGDSMLEFEF